MAEKSWQIVDVSAVAPLTDLEFIQFQKLMLEVAGITLSNEKKPLVSGRLTKRIRECGLSTFSQYLQRLQGRERGEELQRALDLLTTNETYFFREQKHFDFLSQTVLPHCRAGQSFRVWSAACSSGEETYSIAMTLAEALDYGCWSVLGSDLSSRVLDKARSGHYPLERAKDIPKTLLSRYCLKGIGSQEGTFLMDRKLRACTEFIQVNLNAPLPHLGLFDVIFLRNVMIYFSLDTKRAVVARLLPLLKPGGYFFVGHSESLNGITTTLQSVMPAIYKKP